MPAFLQPVTVFFQEFGFSGQVVAGIEECQHRLVKCFNILLEPGIQAVPQFPVPVGGNIDELLPGTVEVPGEPFLRSDLFDLLEDVQLLLRPVRLAGGFVVLPEFADLGIVPCVFRAIVFHYFRSCK